MPRNRTIYQSQSLYVGPSPATGFHFSSGNSGTILIDDLQRIQSISDDFSFSRVNINQFGELAAIDRIQIESPTVSLGFNYILSSFANEKLLGFNTSGTDTALVHILNKTADEKNYFIKTSDEGVDSVGDSDDTVNTKAFGNGFITSYSTQASVGNIPTVDVRVECLNAVYQTGIRGTIPAIIPGSGTRVQGTIFQLPVATSNAGTGALQIAALRPGDITLSFYKRDAEDDGIVDVPTGPYDSIGPALSTAPIQSYTLGFDLSRSAIQRLGQRYASSREINFPVDVNLSIDAIVTDLTTGDLSTLVNCDSAYDIIISLYQPVACGSSTRRIMCQYWVKNAKLNSQSYSASLGSNQTCQLSFSSQIGGPSQDNVGLFMSGIASNGDPNI